MPSQLFFSFSLPSCHCLVPPLRLSSLGAKSLSTTRLRATSFAPARRNLRLPTASPCLVASAAAAQPSAAVDGEDEVDITADAQTFIVGADTGAGERLDRVLCTAYPDMSRSYFQTLIAGGLVTVNGEAAPVKKRKLVAGDVVDVVFETPERDQPLVGEDIPLVVLYEDADIVVINKAAGMVVHPAPGNWSGTLVHALGFRYSEIFAMAGGRPGIVHRLDKGTSGVIIAARSERGLRGMSDIFKRREIEKTYLAVTVGNPANPGCSSCVIEAPLGRSPVDRARMAVIAEDAGGRSARTRAIVLAVDDRSLLHFVEVALETGRTHQIRVHMRHVRAPVLGDDLYGAGDINRRFRTAAARPMLHAARVVFKHPVTGAEIDVRAPMPNDMRSVVERSVMPGLGDRFPEW